MNWIVAKKDISENITKLKINAPEISVNRKPGQHVIVQVDRDSERISLIISRVNKGSGSITLFIHKKGIVHHQLANLVVGDQIYSVEGPFGESVNIKNVGRVICAAGGVGISPLLPIVQAMKEAGNEVITILGTRTREYLILEDELQKYSDELIVLTDDGSYGKKALICDEIQNIISTKKIDQVITYGSAQMIQHSTLITRRYKVPMVSTLFSMRVDGIGMNAAYSVSVCDDSGYICVNGHNFNAYYSNFNSMIKSMNSRLKETYAGNQSYQTLHSF